MAKIDPKRCAERIAESVRALRYRGQPFPVYANVRWIHNEDFPDCPMECGVLASTSEVTWLVGTSHAKPLLDTVGPAEFIINVVGRNTWRKALGADFYNAVDANVREYIVFDPSGIFLRPQLMCWRKIWDGPHSLTAASTYGTVCTGEGVRFDVDGTELKVSRSKLPARDERIAVLKARLRNTEPTGAMHRRLLEALRQNEAGIPAALAERRRHHRHARKHRRRQVP